MFVLGSITSKDTDSDKSFNIAPFIVFHEAGYVALDWINHTNDFGCHEKPHPQKIPEVWR